jgi:hypothetical protein
VVFFDRVDAKTAGPAIGCQDHLIACAPSHKAQPALPFIQLAEARTEIAPNAAILQPMPIAAWHALNCVVFRYFGHPNLYIKTELAGSSVQADVYTDTRLAILLLEQPHGYHLTVERRDLQR